MELVLRDQVRIGGSGTQRDLLEYTVTCALLRAGRGAEALRLISDRRPLNGKDGYSFLGLPLSN
jgi:hypothetical protein